MTYSNHWNSLIYNMWSPVYDWLLRFHPVTRIRGDAIRSLNISAKDRVLLVGVGTGADLEFLSASDLIVGVDLVPAMLNRSTRRAVKLKTTFSALCGDAEQLPCASEQFDVVILSLILSVVPRPRQSVAEAARVLKPCGRILILDKFTIPDRKPSIIRRAVNGLMRFFGTDINRSWKAMSQGLVDTKSTQASTAGGSIRAIVATRLHSN